VNDCAEGLSTAPLAEAGVCTLAELPPVVGPPIGEVRLDE